MAFNDYKNKFIICKVDGKNIQASVGESLLQVCFKAYIDIPRFCYHEGLQIAGNCRMCLVEVENNRKLVASCATPVVNGLSVFTKTFRVKKARQAVLEFLLINHPLDCPICDQGGECDLQDITLIFGSDRGRFYEMSKRAVMDKNLGPLIKTIMNRCIHCTRCVRFFKEVSVDFDKGITGLGVLGRGSRMEIGTYISADLLHELSGNIIDLCPVGALTSKPFAFKARSWELTSQYNFDIVDAFMPRIKMDLSGLDVLRILPYMKEYGHGWISNKTRFFFDSLNEPKSTSCLWRYDDMFKAFFVSLNRNLFDSIDFKFFIKVSWKDAFRLLLSYFQLNFNRPITKYFSSTLSLEQSWELKSFWLSMGVSLSNEKLSLNKSVDFRSFFTIDLSLDSLDNGLWVLLLLGINLRMESPLLFLHIKRLVAKNRVFLISTLNINILQKNIYNLSLTFDGLISFLEGRSVYNRLLLKKLFSHSFLFLTNMEFSISIAFKNLLMILTDIFSKYYIYNIQSGFLTNPSKNVSLFNPIFSISVLQRYVGNISLSELGFYGYGKGAFDFCNEPQGLALYIDVIDARSYRYNLFETNSNILFMQSRFIKKLFNSKNLISNFSLILPFKSSYVEDSQSFFDIFLKQKLVTSIKPAALNEKSFSEIWRTFSTFIAKDSTVFALPSFFINLETWSQGLGLEWLENKERSAFTFTYQGIGLMDPFSRIDLRHIVVFQTCYVFYKLSLSKLMGVKPLLNFYNDTKLNLISFSNTLKRSSLVFKKGSQFESFGLFKF